MIEMRIRGLAVDANSKQTGRDFDGSAGKTFFYRSGSEFLKLTPFYWLWKKLKFPVRMPTI